MAALEETNTLLLERIDELETDVETCYQQIDELQIASNATNEELGKLEEAINVTNIIVENHETDIQGIGSQVSFNFRYLEHT